MCIDRMQVTIERRRKREREREREKERERNASTQPVLGSWEATFLLISTVGEQVHLPHQSVQSKVRILQPFASLMSFLFLTPPLFLLRGVSSLQEEKHQQQQQNQKNLKKQPHRQLVFLLSQHSPCPLCVILFSLPAFLPSFLSVTSYSFTFLSFLLTVISLCYSLSFTRFTLSLSLSLSLLFFIDAIHVTTAAQLSFSCHFLFSLSPCVHPAPYPPTHSACVAYTLPSAFTYARTQAMHQVKDSS